MGVMTSHRRGAGTSSRQGHRRGAGTSGQRVRGAGTATHSDMSLSSCMHSDVISGCLSCVIDRIRFCGETPRRTGFVAVPSVGPRAPRPPPTGRTAPSEAPDSPSQPPAHGPAPIAPEARATRPTQTAPAAPSPDPQHSRPHGPPDLGLAHGWGGRCPLPAAARSRRGWVVTSCRRAAVPSVP